MTDYRTIADEVSQEILSGALTAGMRLPPQREFAYRRGIANATAARVYAELARRGLVTGEVGRGTFVRSIATRELTPWQEHADAPIDMQIAISNITAEIPHLTKAIGALVRPARLQAALTSSGPTGLPGAGAIAARFLSQPGWTPAPQNVLFAGSGRHGIAAALAAISKPGDRIGVEPITYPAIRWLAPKLGIQLVPLEVDEDGVDVKALLATHRAKPLAGLYMQPAIHNPLGFTMPETRRNKLAAFLNQQNIICIEDGVFSFLSDAAPFAAYAPEHVIYIDSLAKRLAPGTGIGFVIPPARLLEPVATAMRAGGWTAASLPLSIALEWITDGSVAEISSAKRAEARERQSIAAMVLKGFAYRADPSSFYVWLDLPETWRADTFAAAAAIRGVAISQGSTFTVQPGHAPNAARLAISSMPIPELRRGLHTVRQLLEGDQTHQVVE